MCTCLRQTYRLRDDGAGASFAAEAEFFSNILVISSNSARPILGWWKGRNLHAQVQANYDYARGRIPAHRISWHMGSVRVLPDYFTCLEEFVYLVRGQRAELLSKCFRFRGVDSIIPVEISLKFFSKARRHVLLLLSWSQLKGDFVFHPLGRSLRQPDLLSKRHEYWSRLDPTITYTIFKKEMWVHIECTRN
jgi:hypothetical protein